MGEVKIAINWIFRNRQHAKSGCISLKGIQSILTLDVCFVQQNTSVRIGIGISSVVT
jgi:hypothetical protein